jgi:hypothetical protein
MIRFLAACHHGRRIHVVVADAAYHGKALRDLPETCTFTTRLPAPSVLFALAPVGCQNLRMGFDQAFCNCSRSWQARTAWRCACST